MSSVITAEHCKYAAQDVIFREISDVLLLLTYWKTCPAL